MKNSVRNLCTVSIFTALMCIIAPLSVPIGPVPITLATLMVYLISALFPVKLAPLIISLYVALGALGLPVFSSFSSGLTILLGPTGGFIFSYIVASVLESLLIGAFKEKKWMYPIVMVLVTVVIYAMGSAWFMYYMKGAYSFQKTMMVCVVPFLLGDSIKIGIASVLSIRFRPVVAIQLARGR